MHSLLTATGLLVIVDEVGTNLLLSGGTWLLSYEGQVGGPSNTIEPMCMCQLLTPHDDFDTCTKPT